MSNWEIRTNGGPLIKASKVTCRGIFANYKSWWDNAAKATPAVRKNYNDILQGAANGIAPGAWSRPVELVDSSGKIVDQYP